MNREDINTPEDLRLYIEENKENIYIREKLNGKWGSYSLEELPEEISSLHIERFIETGLIPVILKSSSSTRRVWKYRLEVVDGSQRITIPHGGKIVHVGNQNNCPTLWVELYPDDPPEERIFRIFGTGHLIEESFWEHVGTCMIPPFVWHIYEWRMKR